MGVCHPFELLAKSRLCWLGKGSLTFLCQLHLPHLFMMHWKVILHLPEREISLNTHPARMSHFHESLLERLPLLLTERCLMNFIWNVAWISNSQADVAILVLGVKKSLKNQKKVLYTIEPLEWWSQGAFLGAELLLCHSGSIPSSTNPFYPHYLVLDCSTVTPMAQHSQPCWDGLLMLRKWECYKGFVQSCWAT